MDLRFIMRDSEKVLQKNVLIRYDIDEESNLVPVYEWQDVPLAE